MDARKSNWQPGRVWQTSLMYVQGRTAGKALWLGLRLTVRPWRHSQRPGLWTRLARSFVPLAVLLTQTVNRRFAVRLRRHVLRPRRAFGEAVTRPASFYPSYAPRLSGVYLERLTPTSPVGGGGGIAQWLERRTRDWKVAGSNPCWNGGRIFFSRVDFLCWLLFRYPFHPRVTTVERKKSRSFCQKCRWQVTAKHAYTLRMWLLLNRASALVTTCP